MKTAIIVDSTAYLNDELACHPDVFQVHLSVRFEDGTEIVDTTELDIVENFYQQLAQSKVLPTTSQPSPGEYYEVLDRIVSLGYDQVIAVHLDKKISGTYQTAVMVSEQYQDKLKIAVINSKGSSVVIEQIVKVALALLAKGKPFDSIIDTLKWYVEETQLYIIAEDLTNLAKGGRLSTTSAILGQLVRVRPILTFAPEGGIVLFEKVRTNKRVYQRLAELVQEAQTHYPDGIDLGFAYTLPKEGMDELINPIQEKLNGRKFEQSIIGPVIGTHLGGRVKGMAIFPHLSELNL